MLSKTELSELVEMARDLGVEDLGEGGVLRRRVEEVNALLFVALWKRLKVVESGFMLLAERE